MTSSITRPFGERLPLPHSSPWQSRLKTGAGPYFRDVGPWHLADIEETRSNVRFGWLLRTPARSRHSSPIRLGVVPDVAPYRRMWPKLLILLAPRRGFEPLLPA